MILYLPYYDTLMVGRPSDGTMTSSNPYLTYSHPIKERIILAGFHVNFAITAVTISMQNKRERDVWTPFYNTPLSAVAGRFTNVEPVRLLPRYVAIEPFSRIQVVLSTEPGSSITNALFTLVGVKELDSEVLCYSSKLQS